MQKNPCRVDDPLQNPIDRETYEDAVSLEDGIYPITTSDQTIISADMVEFDPTGSSLSSDTVDGAIKELNTVDSEVVDTNVFCYRTGHFVTVSVQYYAISQASNVPSEYRPQSQTSVIGWNYSDNQACVFTVQTSGNIYVTDLSNTPLAGTKRVYATISYIV